LPPPPDIHALLFEHITLTTRCRELLGQCEAARDAGRLTEARRIIKEADRVCGRLREIERR
jgi:hypothetical protein